MQLSHCADSPLALSVFGSESTTGHCRLSVLQMTSAASEGSSAIKLSELIMLAPPPSTSEVHTKLGNIELGNRYGVPAHLRQYQGKLFV